MATVEHVLRGCHPEPLSSYLKALGVLRLLGEQADHSARGSWTGDGFVLETTLDDEALEDFFLVHYRPTPVISPWNGSSGFGSEGVNELGAIERSDDPRLRPYREAIAAARRLMGTEAWLGAPARLQKRQQVLLLRAVLPDEAIRWLDAVVVLTGSDPVFPPLAGTGGNDGRLEFSRKFHQRICDLFGLGARSQPVGGWLSDALHGTRTTPLLRNQSPGQFDGGSAGAPNSAPTGAGTSLLNPWDWVLLIEGILVLASGAARRLSSEQGGLAAAPFTVRSSPVGYASASDQEGSRGELWLPLWDRPATMPEVIRLFAEGRADWREHHVSSGLDFAKAVLGLGVDRGIRAFTRQGLLERNGQSTVAVPLGRISTSVSPDPAAGILRKLDPWVNRVRRSPNLPAAVRIALRNLDETTFSYCSRSGRLIRVLEAFSALHKAAAVSPSTRAATVRGLPDLGGDEWAQLLLSEDPSPELRLALSLASASDRDRQGRVVGGWRDLLLSSWDSDSYTGCVVEGLGVRSATAVIAEAHVRRVRICERQQVDGGQVSAPEQPGVSTRFTYGTPPPLGDLAALVRGQLDEVALGRLIAATLLLRIRGRITWAGEQPVVGLMPELTLVGPFYARQPATPRRGDERLLPDASWPVVLASGRLIPVLREASMRLSLALADPVVRSTDRSWSYLGHDAASTARRLGAALAWPIGSGQRRALLDQSCPSLRSEAETSSADDDPGPMEVSDVPT